VPSTLSVNAGEPAAACVCWSEGEPGAARFVVGVVMVKVTGADATVGLDTVIATPPGKAVSAAEIAAVNCVALPKVVARGVPFQLTTEAATKFVPFTTRMNPDAPQYGMEATGVEDGGIEVEVIVGGGGGCGPIVKFTRFDTSDVVVAVVPEDPETAEPGI
jgi:hypothetical protein